MAARQRRQPSYASLLVAILASFGVAVGWLWGVPVAGARSLVVTSSATDFAVQVGDGTNVADFRLNLTESLGSGINSWIDVDSESSPTGFGPELTSSTSGGIKCQLENLVHTNLGKSGTGNDLVDTCATTGGRLAAFEISPARTIIKGTSSFAPWGSGSASSTWQQSTTYTIYANGRIYGKRVVRKLSETFNASTWNYPLRLLVGYKSSPDAFGGGDQTLDNMATSTTGDYVSHAADDFWMFHSSASSYMGDAAMTLSTDWALSDLMNATKATGLDGYLRIGPKDNTSRTWNAGDSDSFNFLLQLKPNNRNTNTAQAPYSADYRSPATLSMASGTSETGSRGDAGSDGWNEDEGTYEVRADGHQLSFTIDGSTTNRYDPIFKINDFYPKTGQALATRTVQHLKLDDNAANTTVAAAVGTAGLASANTSGLTTTSAPRVRGYALTADGQYVSSTTQDLSSWGQGTIELWYRPTYDFNQGSTPVKYIFGTGASGVSGSVYLKHEDSGSGYNRLRFGVYDQDGSPLEHTVEVRSSDYSDLWLAYEWVHLRVTWDRNSTTDNLKIYVNGQYLTQYNTNETAWTTLTPAYTIFWGDYQAGGTDTGSGGYDDIYIHDDVVAGQLGAPVILDTVYRTGTVTTQAASSTITGAGTSWLSNLTAGQAIRILADGDEQWYEIASVEADTSLTLTRAYRGTGGSGKSYEGGGTPIALPQLKVASTAKVLDTDYNLATAGPVASYVAQYLGTVTTNARFEFGLGLSTSTLTQSRYRFYDNANSLTPSDPWPVGGDDTAENTAVATSSGPGDGSVLRLRLALQVGSLDLSAGTNAFKLQYAEAWTCSAVSAWSDVGDAASTTAPWRGYNNAGVADGAPVTSKLLTTSDVAGTYEEENNSAQNPYAVGIGQEVEYDWVLHARDIASSTSYCFRMAKSNGTALDAYSQYPRVSVTSTVAAPVTLTQSRYRLYANTDGVTPSDAWPAGGTWNLPENGSSTATSSAMSGDVVRLRMGITVGGAQLDAASQAFKLQFGSGATCSAVTNWQSMPDGTSTTAPWRGYDNATPADGTTISSLLLSTATVGGSYEEANDSASNPNAIAASGVGEWDWAVQANALDPSTSYCFRMVKSDGSALDTYSVYPQLQTTTTTFATTTFQSGNGENFVRTGNAVSFDSTRDPGTGDTRHTTWFYFSMNFAKAKSIDFTLNNARGANTENTNWANIRPVYSYDQVNWYQVSADGTGAASLDDPLLFTAPGGTATFTADTVYVAYNIPYTYQDAQNDIAAWQATGFVSSTAVLGQSVLGNDIHLLTFEDTNSPVTYRNKRVMWLTSRPHPMEPQGNEQLKGIVDFYTSTTDPEAEVFRRGWILKVIPDYNADGMRYGYTRSNANGYDLNREWDLGGPNVSTEEPEVYLIHGAINTWEGYSYSTSTVHFDMHTQASVPPSAFRGGSSMGITVLEDNMNTVLNLPFNTITNSTAGTTKFNVQMWEQYAVPSWTVEGPDIRWDATNYPSKDRSRAWGKAWAEGAISQYEYNAKVFAFRESTAGTAGTTKTLVVAPNKFQLVFDDAKGGALVNWYDQENNTTHNAQLGDTTYGVDRLEWHDGTAMRTLASSTGVSTTVSFSNGAFVKLVTTGNFGGQSGYPYRLTRFIGEDGRIFSTFELTNSSGGSVNWGAMTQYLSVNNTNFNFVYDNTDATPTPGTDSWFAQVGTSAGSPTIKAVAAAYFVTSSGGFAYDTYGSQTGTPRWAYYQDADGPSQSNGATVTTTWAFQLNPDNDANGSQAQLDAYGLDLNHLDSPSPSVGTFAGLATSSGGLRFAAAGNRATFAYANATSYTKKKPIFVLTGYTAAKAPVLKVNGFLDGESGAAHASSSYFGASYTSYVDDANDTAYLQYLGDVSTNVTVDMGYSLTASAPSDPSGAAATYDTDSQITLNWTDASSDEDSFAVERRTDTGAGYGSWTGIATTSANATSYADTSVAANRKYQYRVRAYSAAGGYSGYSTDAGDVYTTPSAPSQPSGSPDSVSAITWTWTDNAAFESSYRFGLTSGGSTYAAGLAADLASRQVTGLATNTAYAGQAAVFRADRGVVSSTASAAVYTLSAIPTALAVDDDSTTQITATWAANGNPAGTEYYAENTTAATNSGWVTATSWASTGLSCGTSYTFHVRSRNAAGTATSYTGNVSTSTAACPTGPTAPTDALATYDTDSQITLNWTDASSDEDSFAVERRTDTGAGYGSWTGIATTSANATSYADTSVAANRKYQYRVRAYNAYGYSSYSTDAGDVYTTPSAPSQPSGSPDSVSAITWTWTDNAAFESSYRLGFSANGSSSLYALAANAGTYQVTGLATNTTSSVVAAAFRADRGAASSTASANVYTLSAVPSAGAAVDNSYTQITASWNANGNPAGTEYYAENTTAATNSGWVTATSWASTGLSCGTSYTFRVRSRNGDGTASSYSSNFSTSTTACPSAPTAPSGAAATYNSDSQITLDWTDNSSNEDSFVVERRTDTGAGYGSYTVVATTSAGAVTYADTSVAANRKYQYRVRAYNIAGYSAYSTDGSDVYTTPGAPSTPSGVADSVSAITWTWTDNAAFESSYRFGLTSGGSTYAAGLAADLATRQVTGLSTNMPYRGQAAAFRADRGVSSSTASALVYTLANVPGSLAAAEDSGSQITASWNANGNPAGTEYYAENTTAATNSGWTTATSWASTGLTCSTAYDFRVRARNGDAVATSFTSSVTATTTSECPAPPPSSGGGAPAVVPPSSGGGQGNVDPNVGGTVSQQVPAAGGVAQVVFPGGSLPGTAVVSVTPQAPAALAAQAPLPAGTSVAAGMAAQVNVFQGVFPVTTVTVPVTVRFTYTDAALAGADERTLAVYRYDEATRTWLRLPDSRVDAVSNVVWATTGHFSLFAVLAGGAVPAQPAASRLIKAPGNPDVYVVTDAGFRRRIPSEAAFLSYGYRWQDVATVPAAALASFPETALIKLTGDARVYKVEDGRRRWVPDEATFLARRYTWNAVSVVSAAEMAAYPDGPTLTATAAQAPAAAPAAAGQIRSFLTVGSTGAEVRLLQQKLQAAGFYTYPSITGRFGAATREAVVKFQRARGIDPRGYVGPATRAALNGL